MIPLLLPPGRRPMFPPVDEITPGEDGLVALGGDLDPDTLVEAYRKAIFPWDGRWPIPWYSPDPRLILEPAAFHVSKSLHKLDKQGRIEVRFDTAFPDVMRACAGKKRRGQRGTWIRGGIFEGYGALHTRGVAHSVEAWEEGVLVGGLYGLAMGTAFFGESMFTHRPDASKLALLHLCRRMAATGGTLVDCQQDTPHLRSLGAFNTSRADYLRRLDEALAGPEIWPDVVAGA